MEMENGVDPSGGVSVVAFKNNFSVHCVVHTPFPMKNHRTPMDKNGAGPRVVKKYSVQRKERSSVTNVQQEEDSMKQAVASSSSNEKHGSADDSVLEKRYGWFKCDKCRRSWTSRSVYCRAGTDEVFIKQTCNRCYDVIQPYKMQLTPPTAQQPSASEIEGGEEKVTTRNKRRPNTRGRRRFVGRSRKRADVVDSATESSVTSGVATGSEESSVDDVTKGVAGSGNGEQLQAVAEEGESAVGESEDVTEAKVTVDGDVTGGGNKAESSPCVGAEESSSKEDSEGYVSKEEEVGGAGEVAPDSHLESLQVASVTSLKTAEDLVTSSSTAECASEVKETKPDEDTETSGKCADVTSSETVEMTSSRVDDAAQVKERGEVTENVGLAAEESTKEDGETHSNEVSEPSSTDLQGAEDPSKTSPDLPGVTEDPSKASPDLPGATEDPSKASPDLPGGAEDPSKTSPDLPGATEDPSKASPDLPGGAEDPSKTSPDLPGATEDPSKASPDLQGGAEDPSKTSPDLQGATEDPSKASPDLQGGGEDQSKTSPDLQEATEGPSKPSPDLPEGVEDPSKTSPDLQEGAEVGTGSTDQDIGAEDPKKV